MIKTPVILVVLLPLLALGGYVMYHNGVFGGTSPDDMNPVKEITETKSQTTKEEDTNKVEESDATIKNNVGIHIMADGKVMAKDGKEISSARILQDGTIQLQDGTIVTPTFDMRSGANTKPTEVSKPAHVVVDMVGVDFSYDIKQIKVKKGDTVTINFKSNQGFHDWVIAELDAFTDRVNEGDAITSVTFVADQIGTFQYYCSVMKHRQMGMVGYLIVAER